MFRAPVRGAPGSALVLTQPSAGGGAGMPSPSTTSEAVPDARRHFWLGLVASARCQAHALDRCSNGELIGALRRAGGGGQRGLLFSIANIFRLAAPEKYGFKN